MMNVTRTSLLLLASLFLVALPAASQSAVLYTVQPDTEVSVDGTSNKSDWTVYASEIDGFVRMSPDATVEAPGVEAAQITVPAAKLESRRSTIMDRLMRNALNVDEHPNIVYQLTEVLDVTPAADGSSFTLRTRGDLSMSGETHPIEMDVVGTPMDGGLWQFEGEYTLAMSTWGIKRPTAMFGALITGDDVTAIFKAVFGMSSAGSQ